MPSMLLWVLGPLVISMVTARPEILVVAVVLVVGQRFAPDPLRWLRSAAKRRELSRVIAQNPANALAARQLAMLQLDANAPKAARTVLELAKARSADAETLFLLGMAHVRAGDAAAGLVELDAAIAVDERIRYGDAWLYRGIALNTLGRPDEAKVALERFVAINGSSLEGHLRLSRVHDRLGNKDAAAAAKNEASQTWKALPKFQRRQQRLWWLRLITGL
jgi:tetratricopeptide (TPR) repeat protein